MTTDPYIAPPQTTPGASGPGGVRLGIIGLGAMGARVLAVAADHPDVEVVACADPGPEAVERARAATGAAHPGIQFGGDPYAILNRDDIDAVYIASPPSSHAEYAIAALKSGKSVFSEKPLAASIADGEAMAAAAREAAQVSALNFVFADRACAREIRRALRDGEAGDVLGVDIRLTFPIWPREFQRDATWLAERAEGGFVREVGSHFLFLTDRLLGPLTPEHARVIFPAAAPSAATAATATAAAPAAEVGATATFHADGIPVRLTGLVGAARETYEWTLYGSKRSYRIDGWTTVSVSDGGDWTPVQLPSPEGTEHTRLSEFARAVRARRVQGPGSESTLADFDAGLRVLRAVEYILGESR